MIEQRAAAVLETVTRRGGTADLIVAQGSSLSLKARDDALEEHKVSSSQVFGLRIIHEDRVGIAYSEASDPDALTSMVDQAFENARYARAEPHEKILDATGDLATDDDLLCPDDTSTIEDKIDSALTLERELRGRKHVKNVPYNGVFDSTSEQRIFTTSGLTAYSRARVCVASAAALVEDHGVSVMEGTGQASRRFSEIDIHDIATRAHERCLGLLDGKPVASGHYDVVFDEECQVNVFGVFAMMFSGKAAKDGINPMRDKVGDAIAYNQLSVFDSPLNTDGFGYSLFDDEGSATQRTPLIADGQFVQMIHNSATAAHFGMSTTGHASRSARSTLDVHLHHLEVAPGGESEAQLLAGEYLELTDLTGIHSGANAISGDFSFGASGYLCRDGVRQQPVRNVTVAGNFYQMLQRIAAIGDTQHWNLEKTALMARVRFADMAISG